MSAAVAFASAAAAAAGGASRIVASFVVVSRLGSSQSTAGLRYNASGTYDTIRNAVIANQGNWVLPAAAADEWEVLATQAGDPVTTGPIGVWLPITNDLVWLQTVSSPGFAQTELLLRFRRAGSTDPVVALSNTLYAEVLS